RRRGGHAGGAARPTASAGRVRAARDVAAIAASAANAAAGAGRTRPVRRAADRHALADAAGHVAGLALPVAGLVAAQAVDAVAVAALVRRSTSQAIRLLRHAGAG